VIGRSGYAADVVVANEATNAAARKRTMAFMTPPRFTGRVIGARRAAATIAADVITDPR